MFEVKNSVTEDIRLVLHRGACHMDVFSRPGADDNLDVLGVINNGGKLATCSITSDEAGRCSSVYVGVSTSPDNGLDAPLGVCQYWSF